MVVETADRAIDKMAYIVKALKAKSLRAMSMRGGSGRTLMLAILTTGAYGAFGEAEHVGS